MTCIIGYIKDEIVYIGGDSAGVAGYSVRLRKDPKVFKKGQFVFGYTSSFRMGQLIRFSFVAPKQPIKMSDYEYMCTLFIDSLRKCFKKGGYSKVDNNVEEGGTFLVGYKGELYQIEEDFQVGISNINYDAVGCGEDYALGALKILSNTKKTPETIIKEALQATDDLCGGVSAPFNIVNTKKEKNEKK